MVPGVHHPLGEFLIGLNNLYLFRRALDEVDNVPLFFSTSEQRATMLLVMNAVSLASRAEKPTH
jgi:hypothetical protein